MAAEGETNVKDYGIFTDAISTVNKFNTNIKTEYDSIKENITAIDDEGVFAGPAAESIVSESETIRKNIVGSYNNFKEMSKKLGIISSNYKTGDDAANKQITGEGFDKDSKQRAAQIMLVNPSNPLPEGYNPNLVDVEGYKVDKSAEESLKNMLADCRKNGGEPQIISGYRSVDDQTDLYNNAVKKNPNQNDTAKPGYSEHHTGKAVDILEKGYGADWDNAEKTAKTKTQKWLTDNCADYGFVLRYPKGKEKTTGITYESWHYTYVGSPEAAHEIMDNNLTIEEYKEQNK